MTITISAETQKLLERQMQRGFASPDDAIRNALEAMEIEEQEVLEADLKEAIEQCDRGETRPWEEVKEELTQKYIRKWEKGES